MHSFTFEEDGRQVVFHVLIQGLALNMCEGTE